MYFVKPSGACLVSRLTKKSTHQMISGMNIPTAAILIIRGDLNHSAITVRKRPISENHRKFLIP
jgi:hypothetical protein